MVVSRRAHSLDIVCHEIAARSTGQLSDVLSYEPIVQRPRLQTAQTKNERSRKGDGMATQIYVLGAGTPVPSANRYGTSFVVKVGAEHLMFDCGPAATHKLVKAGLWPTQIDRLFFTHHHSDHNVDYPCLLLSRWDQSVGDVAELEVYGPHPTSQLTQRLIGEDTGAFWDDIRARINHPGSQNVFVNRGGALPRMPPDVQTHDIEPGFALDTDNWSLRTGWAAHAQPWLDSIAYRLETPDGSIVFTGDTRYCEEIIELASGADVLMSMCWDDQSEMDRKKESAYGMMGTLDAATIASKAGVGEIVLVHSHTHLDDPDIQEKAREDMAKLYSGVVKIGEEGLRLTLESRKVTTSSVLF